MWIPFLQNTYRRLLLYFHENFFFLRPTIRSSRPELLCKKGVLKNFAKFKGKQLSSHYFNKVAGVSFMENETQAQAFSRAFCEIFRSRFYAEYLFLTETVFQINSNSYKRKVSSKLNCSFRGKIVAEIFTLLWNVYNNILRVSVQEYGTETFIRQTQSVHRRSSK